MKSRCIKTVYVYVVTILLLTIVTSCNALVGFTKINSPDANIITEFNVENELNYSVIFSGDTILANSKISLQLTNGTTLKNFEVLNTEVKSVKEDWERVWGKRTKVTNSYNEITLHLKEKEAGILVDLYCRAYNDGVGIRYGFPEQNTLNKLELASEQTQFAFTGDPTVWRADYETYKSSQEQEFKQMKLSEITPEALVGMPLTVQVSDSAFAVITEANLTDWSGAFLKADAKPHTMVTKLTPYPENDSVAVIRNTPAVSPWRVIMLSDIPGGLIESDIINNLNEPLAYEDVSWIQPGASAWDWWWSNKYAPAADFELGANQETYKYYVDLAAEMGWEYQIVDWQWYGEPFAEDGGPNPEVDITTYIDGIDIPELVQYAKSKNVKIILWLHWGHLQKQMDEALPLYEKWGAAGIKVDFMDRQDQEMVNFYHTVIKKAAEHHLVVDFHGAYKPTGVTRTYPNLVTREGVLGNENNKWSDRVTPEHNVTLAFTRGLLGEMDYTPVGFRNVTPDEFKLEGETEDGSPLVQTTRCQQLAMPVVYESVFTVFCDSPDNYKMGIGAEFLQKVPTTWNDTKVLAAQVGDYIAIARSNGNTWYIGGMTDATERTLNLNFSFLGDGSYKLTLFKDAADANTDPMHAERQEITLTAKDSLEIHVAKGGGFAGYIEKI